MNNVNPIYTEKTECQDCYKCIRECPVKAIKMQYGAAEVVPELCIVCGHCVDVCPVGAKKVRDDLPKAQELIKHKKHVIASLAPSFYSEFGNVEPAQLIAGLKKLGFSVVSETAIGAQQVSAHIARQLSLQKGKYVISSACPPVVDLITRYIPSFTESITNLLSPMLAHSKFLRKQYSAESGIVFVGPCIGKKREADSHPQLIDAVLTYSELRRWFELENIDITKLQPTKDDIFEPSKAEEGAMYPVDGGMVATIKTNCTIHDACFMSFSGLETIKRALGELESTEIEDSIFIEGLACEGGCINGPCCSERTGTIKKRYSLLKQMKYPKTKIPRTPSLPIVEYVAYKHIDQYSFTEEQMGEALRMVGKLKKEDELNCGGCGYDSCRDFATSLLAGKAERTMCVTYMRKLAQNKASGLLRTMPSGVVIIDEQLKIIESNRNFASIFGPEIETLFDKNPGMEGADLKTIAPFHSLFEQVSSTGEDMIHQDIQLNDCILQGSIFVIEPQAVIGGVFADITHSSAQKDVVINRTKNIIQKNLSMLQKISNLLGENASESEKILESLIESFSSTNAVQGDSET